MLRLSLVRHARAVAAADNARDYDRILAPAGETEATEAAARLAARGARPDLILSSPAPRALQTATLLAKAWPAGAPPVATSESLYLASGDLILEIIHRLPPRGHLLIVGHNPGISDLARRLGGDPVLAELATAAIVAMEFDVADWQSIRPGGPAPQSVERL